MKALIAICVTAVCGMMIGEMVVSTLVDAVNSVASILRMGR